VDTLAVFHFHLLQILTPCSGQTRPCTVESLCRYYQHRISSTYTKPYQKNHVQTETTRVTAAAVSPFLQTLTPCSGQTKLYSVGLLYRYYQHRGTNTYTKSYQKNSCSNPNTYLVSKEFSACVPNTHNQHRDIRIKPMQTKQGKHRVRKERKLM